MARHRVVLVPGFFGFGSLGRLTYFVGVREALDAAFARLEIDVDVVEVPTLPTASIRQRAARVVETLASVVTADVVSVHIVGHSTGGLDARLALAPNASLPTKAVFAAHDRLRTVITVCTPHFGTPVASAFGSAAGYPLLRVAAALTVLVLRNGHLPLRLALRLAHLAARADDVLGWENTVADNFFRDVIADFSPETRAELIAFIDGVSKDQSLIFQLTPAGADLLNAATADPAWIRYGSVVCRARSPRWTNVAAFAFDPYAQAMHLLYALLHRLASLPSSMQVPPPVPAQRVVLETAFGAYPVPNWSDGIVPTLSQIWGEVIHAAEADHLDVVGHHGALGSERATADWLPSRSGFDVPAFDALWSAVASVIAEEARRRAPTVSRRNVGRERTAVDAAPLARRRGRRDRTATAQAREVLQTLPS